MVKYQAYWTIKQKKMFGNIVQIAKSFFKKSRNRDSFKQSVVRKYAKKNNISCFVETGTYMGFMLEAIKKDFAKIYSVELDADLYRKALEKFSNEKNIKILNGDSGELIGKALTEVNEPCLFWLDAHYSGGITAKGSLNTPIMKELSLILDHSVKNHIILIDDARYFTGNDDYPTIDEVRIIVRQKRPDLNFAVKDDVIRIHK